MLIFVAMESEQGNYEVQEEAILRDSMEDVSLDGSSLEFIPVSASSTTDNNVTSSILILPNLDLTKMNELTNDGTETEEQTFTAMATNVQRSYTVKFKLEVLDWYYKNGENKTKTARAFDIDRKRVRDWLRDEVNLRSDPNPGLTRKKRAGCPPLYKEIESALYQWYVDQKDRGFKPKNMDLKAKSLEFAEQLGLQGSFKASGSWLGNWKRRNKTSEVQSDPNISDDQPVDAEEQLNESENCSGSVGEEFGGLAEANGIGDTGFTAVGYRDSAELASQLTVDYGRSGGAVRLAQGEDACEVCLIFLS